ncbi:type II CRISPR-associated endonuclease Cas1 (plasmid) [Nicoliella spurrieriana]|uniref:CRISPR-associated endonuclease Cas1 n=1 Tax=Nicoliella spurrieriana TaxID=2925830 RepID=A0A976X4V3_9LACO|nr:type II CRISPR-associated endonuclease Cas1 [Nicoliella spurrieriana]UQS85966.1 type II CRISPR-associated endonuclease Cas1 [Nicoliella spurrieriana]
MAWRNVVITKHSKLSYSSNMMVVQSFNGIYQIPISDINIVLVDTTQAVITSALISRLNEQQVKIIFTDDKKMPICETVNNMPNNRSVELLRQQFNWDENRKVFLWTQIVMAKIKNQINVIKGLAGDYNLLEYELNKVEVNDVTNREAVVARKYFPMLFDQIQFSRHNPNEHFNDALNYGYSILLSMVNKKIVSDGYITYIGIHHHSDNNAFNLGSDLMEPFRPIIDAWVSFQNFEYLTPKLKYGLVSLLNLEINFNGKRTLLMNAINSYVHDCLMFLTDGKKNVKIEVDFINEVSDYAINGNV